MSVKAVRIFFAQHAFILSLLSILILINILNYQPASDTGVKNSNTFQSTTSVYAADNIFDKEITFKDLEAYENITRRPLFFSSRSNINEEIEPVKKANIGVSDEKLKHLILTGILLAPEKKIAILHNNEENKVIKIALGESFNGWTLKDIKNKRISFKNREFVHEKILFKPKRNSHIPKIKKANRTKSRFRSQLSRR